VNAGADAVSVSSDAAAEKLPPTSVVEVSFPTSGAATAGAFNLYLHNGDRLHCTVVGDGDGVLCTSADVTGLRVPLRDVLGVRFGRVVGPLAEKYESTFRRALEGGRDTVIAVRSDHPTPVRARVLGTTEASIVARLGAEKEELPASKVYGFVLAPEGEPAQPKGMRMRVHLADGGRVTIPYEKITEDAIFGGGARIGREAVRRLEFLGEHVAHLSDFEPIDVKQRALFGKAHDWRRDRMVLGGPLVLGGRVHARGIGTAAYTRLEYILGTQWNALFVLCGIDDAAGGEGDAIFRVLGDGRLLKEIRCRAGNPPQAIRLDVTGVDRLVLEVDPGDSYVSDLCDWAEARVFKTR
jgi:hypothetical protein